LEDILKQPDDFQLYSAVMAHGAFNWGLEEPEIEVGFNVDSFQVKDDKFEGKTSQYTLDSSSLSDFIDGHDWKPYFWQFSFSGRWIENDKGFEITDTEYIGDGSRDPINLENSKDRGALETVFKSHEIAEFLDDNEMTENDFWKSVLPEYKWLKDGV
jgi:hypothetical protein